ncbi:MAG: hypothetical protein HYY55_03185 [Candidatus Niyogibacteria bacterium]|nr:MAG: hypothetical protein HYY55_03185 [Candidatus Niyogibacteria bacterium]
MIYAVVGSIIIAVVGFWGLRLIDKLLPGVFVGKDRRPHGEPIMLVSAFLFDYFVGKNGFTMWMGWWFFLYVLLSFPWHIYGNILIHLRGDEYCKKHYQDLIEWRHSHRTFVYLIYYALFLYFWWKWII